MHTQIDKCIDKYLYIVTEKIVYPMYCNIISKDTSFKLYVQYKIHIT